MPLIAILAAAMLLYGVAMWLMAPRARRFDEFFAGRSSTGREVGAGLLIASVVISWLFAKSITNAANLGHAYGLVGSVAYAGWYLSIPVAGVVLYAIRLKTGARSLAAFVTGRYGRAAAGAFVLVILVRLMNEVWSNTAVVGAYFGASGTAPYFAGALVFAAVTLVYSLRGGLRSSIVTDLAQFGLGLFLLVFVVALLVRGSGAAPLLSSGEWTLRGGVDLLLVALLQSFSYPFHDPVLTDRGFITRPKVMLASYLAAGVTASLFIVVFGLVGVFARVQGIDAGQDAPLRVAEAFGVAVLTVMTLLMMVSAGSTLDSTLSSFGRVFVVDLGGVSNGGEATGPGAAAVGPSEVAAEPLSSRVRRWVSAAGPLAAGRWVMVAAVIVGSLPLFTGAAILQATTVSGTMVIGLAPIFLLFAWRRAGSLAFHLAFWPGLAVGVLYALGRIPAAWAIGDGPYAVLLGANVVGTAAVFTGFAAGALLPDLARRMRRTPVQAASLALLALALGAGAAWARDDAPASRPSPADSAQAAVAPAPRPRLDLGGQTMIRFTGKLRDLDRPAVEVYQVRLLGDAEQERFRFHGELRFRQTKFRSYSPSTVWIQEAYGSWRPPDGGFEVKAGLVYDQLGLFWDGSWFGNLPYLNGHKLDPDLNLELSLDRELGASAGVRVWLQASPGEDGLNGTFVTETKEARLRLPADPEVSTEFREALALRARVVPRLQLGGLRVEPGASVQRSTYDRSAIGATPAATGHQTVYGAEFTARAGPVRLLAEYLSEALIDLGPGRVERRYVVAGGTVDLVAGRTHGLRALQAGASWQRAEYDDEGFHEWFLTSRVFGRVNDLFAVTVEYVRWELSGRDEPELDRVELILHLFY